MISEPLMLLSPLSAFTDNETMISTVATSVEAKGEPHIRNEKKRQDLTRSKRNEGPMCDTQRQTNGYKNATCS